MTPEKPQPPTGDAAASLAPATGSALCPCCGELNCPVGDELQTLSAEIEDNERWMREVLTDFKIGFDDHKFGRRFAFTRWMFDHMTPNADVSDPRRA